MQHQGEKRKSLNGCTHAGPGGAGPGGEGPGGAGLGDAGLGDVGPGDAWLDGAGPEGARHAYMHAASRSRGRFTIEATHTVH